MKINYNAPFTLTFTLIAVLIFALNQITPVDLNNFLATPANFHSLRDLFSFAGIFFHPFAHRDLDHISGNLMLFILLSPILEEKYGAVKMLEMSFITAIITSIFHMIFFPNSVLIGASGLVFMMIILVSFTGNKEKGVPLTMILIMIIYLGKEILNFFNHDSISQSAHIIGGLMGASFAFTLKPKIEKFKKLEEKIIP